MRLANSQSRSNPAAAAQEAAAQYAACVFEPKDVVEVRRLPCGRSTWHRADTLSEVVRELIRENRQGQHIYVGANPRRVWDGTRSKDVACARCLFVDFDGIDQDTAWDRWCDAGLPTPTLIIASGHGVHAYWRLAEPMTDMALWTRYQKGLIALLGSDGAIHDPARIMRLPVFLNHKEPVAACSIMDDNPARIYDLKRLRPLVNSATKEREDKAAQATHNLQRQSSVPFNNGRGTAEMARRAAAKWPSASKGGRNARAFQNAAYLVKNLGLTEAQAWPILQQWNCKNRPPLPQWELRQTLRNARIYGRHRTDN